MNEEVQIKKEEGKTTKNQVRAKKRGRKPKNYREPYQLNRDQTKFFVDLSKEKENLEKVFDLLEQANKKSYGREVYFKDLALQGLEKLTSKDIEKIQENSLSKMEKVEQALDEYNKKHGKSLALEEFLVKKLGIS